MGSGRSRNHRPPDQYRGDGGRCLKKPGPCPAVVSLLVLSGVSAVYIHTLHPSVAGGDSGELITAACELGEHAKQQEANSPIDHWCALLCTVKLLMFLIRTPLKILQEFHVILTSNERVGAPQIIAGP
ncbi:uncharacterized protein LOC115082074 isoform X2 [Rhinatrema bivittatum]|uniref:uncharacterized protein LOC115082074 isoform X2 n=1 Tax=Rhinatrema bivittatum TaxID=194408 RepID=UPI00112EC8DE|nr:uncharacterized protein LOC115082074 isoform X2 [Rhinatrema bivittatum]